MTKQNTQQVPEEWKITTFGEVVHIIGGGTPKTSIKEYWNGDIPWISVTDFSNDRRWIDKTERTITKAGLENSATKLLDPGDLIISARGTVGSFAQLKRAMAFNQTSYGLRANELTFNDFLFYLLKSSIRKFQKNVHGAVFDTITKDTFNQIDILLPPLPEQRAIASVFSAFDDKIELLREQNKTLEAIAKTLFKQWFVEFNFPDEDGQPYCDSGGKMVDSELGEIPEGWGVDGLDEIADFLNGLALQKYPPEKDDEFLPVIKIRELKSGITDQTDKASRNIDPKYIIHDGDVIFSWSGSLEIGLWKYGEGALNQHLFKVSSAKYPKWFYYFWVLQYLPYFRSIAESKTTTMGHIRRHHLSESLVAIPDKDFMDFSDSIISPVFNHVISNNSQIQTLSQLRDTLLPKLMRGEVRAKGF